MSVLLPAPFSPMRACTSPSPTSSETSRSAWVAPKRFCTPLILSRSAIPRSFQILVERGMEQLFDFRLLHVFGCHELRSSVDALFNLLALQMFVERDDAEVT